MDQVFLLMYDPKVKRADHKLMGKKEIGSKDQYLNISTEKTQLIKCFSLSIPRKKKNSCQVLRQHTLL